MPIRDDRDGSDRSLPLRWRTVIQALLHTAGSSGRERGLYRRSRLSADVEEEEEDFIEWADDLVDTSNTVVNLVQAGELDHAEMAARGLLTSFPDVHNGYGCLGMVYDARRDCKQAANCYRKVIEFVRTLSEDCEPSFQAPFQQPIEELDPTEVRLPPQATS